MLTLSELKRMAAREGVPQAIVEKDYALSVALKALSGSELAKKCVFKGGTAIRKAYFKEARYSEDLDFTAIGMEKGDCMRLLRSALEGKASEGIAFAEIEEVKTAAGLKAAVKYLGPLGYAQRIRFDFNFRDNLAEKPKERKLIDSYGIGPAKMQVLSIEEIFAEKLHALGSRSAPRDLYDVWFLLGKGVRADSRVLGRKFGFYNEKFDAKKAIDNARKSEGEWKRDLQPLLRILPDYGKVEREVEKGLGLFFSTSRPS
jgi:predicted nucleotidyltransferase component of viral defense system